MKKNDFFLKCCLFLKVIDLQSLGKAARAFDISASQASRHIKSLEEELGTQLVEAGLKGLKPTAKGLYFAKQIQPLISEFVRIERDLVHGVQYKAKLSFPLSLGTYCFPAWIANFQKDHPEAQLSISLNLAGRITSLDQDECRVIMAPSPPELRVLATKLCEIKLVNVASPAYLNRFEPLINFRHLKGKNIYCCTKENPIPLVFLNGEKKMSISSELTEEIDSFLMAKGLAVSAAGIALGIPFPLISQELENGDLVEVLTDWRLENSALWLLRLPQRYTSLLAKLLSKSLLEAGKNLALTKTQY